MPRWSAERRAPFAKGAPLKQSSMQRKLVCWRQLVRLSALRYPSLSRGSEKANLGCKKLHRENAGG